MTKTFPIATRLLHWTMAVLIVAMLFIGVAMVSSLSAYHLLVSVHKPLGVLILGLLVIRIVNRFANPPPPLPADMPASMRFAAHASHWLLYGLMAALPLIGWGMLSAAAYPIVLIGPLHLPPILPHSNFLYSVLRRLHTALAFMLFAVFTVHVAAALLHGLIFRDGVLQSMATWRRQP